MTARPKGIPELVDTPDSLTAEWFTAALQHGGRDVVVDGVDVAPIGTGQMGACYRIDVRYASGDGPGTFVAKLPSQHKRARAAAASTYRTEVTFYRDLAPTLAIDVPECFFAEFADEGESFVLVLENLGGQEQGDQIVGCSVEHARAAVTNLAGLHGPRWCDEALRDVAGLGPLGLDDPVGTAAFMVELLPLFVERFEISDADVALLNAFAAKTGPWLAGRRERFGLVHGDYRLDNVMFATDASGRACSAVDWQLVSLGLPTRDLGLFLSTGLEPDDLDAAERDLVGAYHDALVAHGVDGYSFDECLDDYHFGMFQGPLIAVLGAMFVRRTERGDTMFRTMSERSCEAIRRAGALDLLA
jgi:hypothetical protein